jgi:uncharacterized iron-regulated membrane protein
VNPRRTLLTAHLIIGAVLAPVLVVLGITGAILAVQPELEDASNSLLTHLEPTGSPLSLHDLTARLQASYPGAELSGVRFPERADRAVEVTLHRPDSADADLIVNPYSGVVLGLGEEIWSLRPVHDLHTKLLIKSFGSEITGWAAVGLLFLSVSGLILWWPGKILTIVRTGSSRRILFHLHSALAAYSWLALFCFGLTGVVLHWQTPAYDLVSRVTGAAPIPNGVGPPAAACRPGSTVEFDRLLATAAADQPDAHATWIQANGEPGDPVRVVMRYPGDRTPAGRTVVYLDPCTGAVRSSISTRTAPVAYRMVRQWNRELHTGDLLGWPTRSLAFLFSLTLPVVAVSGPLLWWSRKGRKAGSQED